jgi:hypothetical protein
MSLTTVQEPDEALFSGGFSPATRISADRPDLAVRPVVGPAWTRSWTLAHRCAYSRAMAEASRYDDVCFFIAPIGAEGSEIRRRSDLVHDFIVKPAVETLRLRTVRADQVDQPGQMTLNVFEHVMYAKAAVADLTGANPNVVYELAVRHTAQLPVVLIADEAEIPRLPFDINQMRVIGFDHQDLASVDATKQAIAAHLTAALGGAVDSPISTMLNLKALSGGTSAEQALAELASQIEGLGGLVLDLHRGMSAADLERGRLSNGLGIAQAELIARVAVDAERRGFDVSFAESPLDGPHLALSVPIPDRAPETFMVPLTRLTEERIRNLFRHAERARRPEAFQPGTAPPRDWTHELRVIPDDEG